MQSEYFGPRGQRSSRVLAQRAGALEIGERVMLGFDMIHRRVETPDGETLSVTYFQSDIKGDVWALYF